MGRQRHSAFQARFAEHLALLQAKLFVMWASCKSPEELAFLGSFSAILSSAPNLLLPIIITYMQSPRSPANVVFKTAHDRKSSEVIKLSV